MLPVYKDMVGLTNAVEERYRWKYHRLLWFQIIILLFITWYLMAISDILIRLEDSSTAKLAELFTESWRYESPTAGASGSYEVRFTRIGTGRWSTLSRLTTRSTAPPWGCWPLGRPGIPWEALTWPATWRSTGRSQRNLLLERTTSGEALKREEYVWV